MDSKILKDVYNNEYFKINRVLQETTGLWPYQSRLQKLIRRCIVLFVLGIVTIPHVSVMININICASVEINGLHRFELLFL